MEPPDVQPPLQPDTTAEQDRTTAAARRQLEVKSAGQRNINQVWEYTQAAVALIVVATTSAGVFIGRTVLADTSPPFPAEWWTIVGLVIGFYFGRTNHARVGDPPPPV
jgi:hypothetical protein